MCDREFPVLSTPETDIDNNVRLTATGFVDRAGMEKSKLLRPSNILEVGRVADKAYTGFLRGERLIISGRRNRMFVNIPCFLSRRVMTRIVRKMQAAGK